MLQPPQPRDLQIIRSRPILVRLRACVLVRLRACALVRLHFLLDPAQDILQMQDTVIGSELVAEQDRDGTQNEQKQVMLPDRSFSALLQFFIRQHTITIT